MSPPHFAPYPNAQVRQKISPADWSLILDSWISLSDIYLRLDDKLFSLAISENSSLVNFLLSFSREVVHSPNPELKQQTLRKKCFFLLHRLLSREEPPDVLLSWSALADFCQLFLRNERFSALIQDTWKRKGTAIEGSLQTAKASLIQNLELKRLENTESTLNRLVPLMRVSSDASRYMLTGSDFLDAISIAYPQVTPSVQKKMITTMYLGLVALLEGHRPNHSLLSDLLYSLKSYEEQERRQTSGKKTLPTDLVTNTPLLAKIREKASAPEAARVRNIAASLAVFQQASVVQQKKVVRRKAEKEKNLAQANDFGDDPLHGQLHVQRMSMVTQVQDLFPDLGAGFVTKLLDRYDNDVVQVTAHLLEDTLPQDLANADRSEPLRATAVSELQSGSTTVIERQLPERHNAFDDDDFDKLAVQASRLHVGKRDAELTADKILSDRGNLPAKSSILAALAAFDSDDDERDDTYDAEDVGASVDTATPGPDEADADLRDKNEEALFRAFSVSPSVFSRDSETRRSKARSTLKSETNMTDEAIEGWGIIISRDPKRLRRLEAKFSAFSGQQRELESTAWNNSPADSDGGTGGISGDAQSHRRGQGRGRGRGRGRGGRGTGSVAGPADDRSTQIARQRKDANKGARANHNRKDQRGKKMARGLLG